MKIEFDIQFNRHTPVYMQIVNYYKSKVASGVIRNGDELPSRRELALKLAINPNTVQKSYAILSDEGYISSENTAKSLAIVNDITVENATKQVENNAFDRIIQELISLGYSKRQSLDMLDRRWKDDK